MNFKISCNINPELITAVTKTLQHMALIRYLLYTPYWTLHMVFNDRNTVYMCDLVGVVHTEAGRKCNMQLKSNYKYIPCTFAVLPCCRFSPAQWPSQHVYLASVNMGWKAARDPGMISTRLVILFMQTVTRLSRREQWMDSRLMESFPYCLKTLSLMDS